MIESILFKFCTESNMIEGIFSRHADQLMFESFLGLRLLTLGRVSEFALRLDPKCLLRDRSGMDVSVGTHRPLRGGTFLRLKLDELLNDSDSYVSSYRRHHLFEKLHPFMDGNGRTGRAIWLWKMIVLGLMPFDEGGRQIDLLTSPARHSETPHDYALRVIANVYGIDSMILEQRYKAYREMQSQSDSVPRCERY